MDTNIKIHHSLESEIIELKKKKKCSDSLPFLSG